MVRANGYTTHTGNAFCFIRHAWILMTDGLCGALFRTGAAAGAGGGDPRDKPHTEIPFVGTIPRKGQPLKRNILLKEFHNIIADFQ